MDDTSTARPGYDDLPLLPGTTVRSAWGHYGADDQLGALNLLTPEVVSAAAAEVRTGRRFSLSMPLTQPDPPFYGRRPYRHSVVDTMPGVVVDDSLDGFYPQAGSQLDALAHFSHPVHGFYNGHTREQVAAGALGIDGPGGVGIVTRGVLLDVARWAQDRGGPLEPGAPISAEVLEETARTQGVRLQRGDALCVRTGWVEGYRRAGADERARWSAESVAGTLTAPGLAPGAGIARLVWESGVSVLAVDNPGVEPAPTPMVDGRFDLDALCHIRVMVALGVQLGELFDLEALSEDCAADRRWTFLFVSAPLRIPGGIGTPCNALAVR
jgi:kynurenine formamidase